MKNPDFIYIIYVKTTPEKLWNGITNPEVTRRYWGHDNISDWTKGSKWRHVANDEARTVRVVGEVQESVPPGRLVLTWADPADASARSGHSRVTFEIEPLGEMARLTVTHANLKAGSETERKIRSGWPRVLSSLKSLLETGTALDTWAGRGRDFAKAG